MTASVQITALATHIESSSNEGCKMSLAIVARLISTFTVDRQAQWQMSSRKVAPGYQFLFMPNTNGFAFSRLSVKSPLIV